MQQQIYLSGCYLLVNDLKQPTDGHMTTLWFRGDGCSLTLPSQRPSCPFWIGVQRCVAFAGSGGGVSVYAYILR